MTPQQEQAAEKMFKFLKAVYPFSPGLKEELEGKLKFLTVKKGRHILKEGEFCRNLYFVSKGLLRCYYYTDAAVQVSTWFMRETDVCVSVDSFYGQIRSYEYIQAVENSELIYISYEELQELYRMHMEFNFVGRVLTVKYLMDWTRQLKDIRLLQADDRYKALNERDPDLVRRVPQKYLATYLNMLPTSLSRLRRPPKKAK